MLYCSCLLEELRYCGGLRVISTLSPTLRGVLVKRYSSLVVDIVGMLLLLEPGVGSGIV